MKQKLLLVLLIVSLGLPAHATADQNLLVENFRGRFLSYLNQAQVPGGAFAVVSRDKIIHIETAGYRQAGDKSAIGPDTVFRIASVSKTFAAGLTGLLVEEGKLDWDESISRHKPEFRISGNTGAIKLKHVLGQSSGLIPHAFDNLIEDGWAVADIYSKFRELNPICSPGRCYSYQNSLFSLIEHAISNVTEESYAAALRKRIFEPLEMATASVGYRPFLQNDDRAIPHKRRQGRWRPVTVEPNYYRVPSAAGVNASITDMAQWVQAQLGGRPEVLDTELVAQLTQPRVQTKREFGRRHWRDMLTDAHYGLGWRVYRLGDEELVYHGGWVAGFRADVAYSKSHNLGMIILLNAEAREISAMSTAFWKLALPGAP